MGEDRGLAWHQALVFALTGERLPELGRQDGPDVAVVLSVVRERAIGAFAVPADLAAGIGPAHLAAVLTELRARLSTQRAHPVVVDRPPDAEERRLLADVPPHH